MKRYVVKSGTLYWDGHTWTPCIACARRMDRKNAHSMAHSGGRRWTVVRVKTKGVYDA